MCMQSITIHGSEVRKFAVACYCCIVMIFFIFKILLTVSVNHGNRQLRDFVVQSFLPDRRFFF